MTAEVNIPDEAVKAAAEVYGGQIPDHGVKEMLEYAASLIVAEARRQWEAEQEERMAAEVRDIANARHIHVQRGVDVFVDRCGGNVSAAEFGKRYQQGVDRWNEMHPALLALWERYNALVEAAELRGESR